MVTPSSHFREAKYSFKVIINRSNVRKDGDAPIYLRVRIDGVKREFPLNLYWPPDRFDDEDQIVMDRYPGDPDANDFNLMINTEKGDANEIFKIFRLSKKVISMPQFAKAFKNKASRGNFLAFFLNVLDEQVRAGFLDPGSKRIYMTTYNRLVKFNEGAVLSFTEMSLDFVRRFEVYMRDKLKLKYNTIMGSMKDLRHICKLALDEGSYVFEYPFEKYSIKMVESDREALEIEEVQRLIALMDRDDIDERRMLVLKKFIFSCFTGMRISDNKLVEGAMIRNGILRFSPHKTRKRGTSVEIPLPKAVQKIVRIRNGKLFQAISDAECNRHLKPLFRMAKIKKHGEFRISRDTFGTLFIEMGGDLVTLKKLMGHKRIETTMIYQKISEKRKQKQMSNFNKIWDGTKKPLNGASVTQV